MDFDCSVVLASASPRRNQLLSFITEDFHVKAADADESSVIADSPQELVMKLSELKTDALGDREDALIIGSDTVVSLDEDILGKPKDEADAYKMLKMLSGRKHRVYTGVTVKRGKKKLTKAAVTEVEVSCISDEELWEYINTGDCMDKAGAYGIQGPFARFVKSIDGCYYNVMGLPVSLLYEMLKEFRN